MEREMCNEMKLFNSLHGLSLFLLEICFQPSELSKA